MGLNICGKYGENILDLIWFKLRVGKNARNKNILF
jgi:hypothetical protein